VDAAIVRTEPAVNKDKPVRGNGRLSISCEALRQIPVAWLGRSATPKNGFAGE